MLESGAGKSKRSRTDIPSRSTWVSTTGCGRRRGLSCASSRLFWRNGHQHNEIKSWRSAEFRSLIEECFPRAPGRDVIGSQVVKVSTGRAGAWAVGKPFAREVALSGSAAVAGAARAPCCPNWRSRGRLDSPRPKEGRAELDQAFFRNVVSMTLAHPWPPSRSRSMLSCVENTLENVTRSWPVMTMKSMFAVSTRSAPSKLPV